MLYVFLGTDRVAARAAMQKKVTGEAKGRTVIRITDAHSLEDFSASLQGGGMFGEKQVVVFENILSREDIAIAFFAALTALAESSEPFFLFEEKLDAATKKKVEKYAETSEKYDAAKAAKDNQVFDLAYAMQRGDKKKLWVGYMRELAKGAAPEAIHGILFWAAKSQLLKSREGTSGYARAEKLVTSLVELPHEARRKGFDMEYALEAFVLSVA